MLRLGTILTFMQNVIRPRKRRSFVQKPTTFVKSFTTQTQIFRCTYYSLLHDILLHLNIAIMKFFSCTFTCCSSNRTLPWCCPPLNSWGTQPSVWWSRAPCIKQGCLKEGKSTGKNIRIASRCIYLCGSFPSLWFKSSGKIGSCRMLCWRMPFSFSLR